MLLLTAFLSWLCLASAGFNESFHSLNLRRSIAGGVKLRVLPIGDSITRGSGDPSHGGYRKALYEDLARLGNDIEFVGSLSEGELAQNNHEGHRGKRIEEIEDLSKSVGMVMRPNIALVHAGTNDMNQRYLMSTAHERLEDLIRTIIAYSPKVTVLVCQIVPSTTPSIMSSINDFNAKVPGVVSRLRGEGFKVALVDMRILSSSSDLADNLHPNRQGYRKMADRYYSAIMDADARGWISPPEAPGSPTFESCKDPNSWHTPVTIAQGPKIAQGDGDWTEKWIKRGVVANGNCPRARLHFADFDGDGIMDYACVSADKGAVQVNLGKVNANGVKENLWGPRMQIASGRSGRNGTAVQFADLNGDGRADYVYLDQGTGAISAWINDGPGAADGGYHWRSIGIIANRADATVDSLRFADFTGDGRDDFLIINQHSGQVRGWVNRGDFKRGDMPTFHGLGVLATGSSHETGVDKVLMGDFTGKGRADYLLVKAGGKTTGFINRLKAGSMIPAWGPQITVAGGPTGARQAMVRLADLDGDGDVDYLLVDEKTGEVQMWENAGSGGRYQAGEGVIFADLNGDGTKDYVWIDHVGNAYGWVNTGKGTDKWDPKGLIVQPGSQWARPQNVRTAVLTKSGRADYIALEEGTGRAQWWRNNGLGTEFQFQGQAARGVWEHIGRKSGFGWKFKTQNVRFADIDGDGLDDYVYVSDFGATLWWRNMGVEPINFEPYKTVAEGPGITAVDVQFADVDGDGKVDYIVTSQITAAAKVWFNRGFSSDRSHIIWSLPATLALGPDGVVGRDVRLVEVSGDSRADYVVLDPSNGASRMWRSRCNSRTPELPDGNGGGPDDWDDYEPEYAYRNWDICNANFRDISHLRSRSDLRFMCIDKYIAETEAVMLEKSLIEYRQLGHKDYDHLFRIYEKSLRETLPGQVERYMKTAKDKKFFRCERIGWSCCSDCGSNSYCHEDCNRNSNCKAGTNAVVTCPSSFPDRHDLRVPKIKYICTDEKAFFQDIAKEAGVLEDWIKWGRRLAKLHPGCSQSSDPQCGSKSDTYWTGWPEIVRTAKIPNPKDTFTKSKVSFEDLVPRFRTSVTFADEGPTSYRDLSDAGGVPAFMFSEAVSQMKYIIEEAEKKIKEDRKTAISAFLMGLLMLIPAAGTTAGAIGFAGLRTVLGIAGVGAEVGVLIYDVVEDPASAVYTVFSFIMGGGASRQPFREAARARRSMKTGELNKLGPVKTGLQQIDGIRAPMCKRR